MPNRFAAGCGCCGGGLDPADCCKGADFSSASITNFLMTDTSTSETWTQTGASDWRGDDLGFPCRFSVPVESSVSGADTARVQYEGSDYSGSAGVTSPDSGGWSVQDLAGTQFGQPSWIAGDGSVSFTSGNYTVEFDVSGEVACGCCRSSPSDCAYEADAITNLSLDLGGTPGYFYQVGPSRFLGTFAPTYCIFEVPVFTTGSTTTIWTVERESTGRWVVKDNLVVVQAITATGTSCGGTMTFLGFPYSTGSMDVTSSGNCP